MQNKLGIVTFHASHNYGSCLQAFALQNKLAEMGMGSEIINFRTKTQKELYRVFTKRKSVKYFLKNLYTLLFIYRGRKEKFRLFENFINQKLLLTKEVGQLDDFVKEADKFETVIAGSDQIWNVEAEDFHISYMLPNVQAKKIAYAISTGDALNVNMLSELHVALISQFDALSVRDQETQNMILQKTNRKAEIVLDPTMLYDQAFYDQLIGNNRLIKGDYIYLYTLGNSRELLKVAQKLSKKTGLPIYISNVSGTNFMFGLKKQMATGPIEFLNHIKYAKYVVTSSFHGTIFSIVFKKQFWSFNAEKDNRRKELLLKLNLIHRSINLLNCEQKFEDTISVEQYKQVEAKIESLRKTSIEFLHKN